MSDETQGNEDQGDEYQGYDGQCLHCVMMAKLQELDADKIDAAEFLIACLEIIADTLNVMTESDDHKKYWVDKIQKWWSEFGEELIANRYKRKAGQTPHLH